MRMGEPYPNMERSLLKQTNIFIPASIKWEVRDKLDQANLNERTLFGGLDGLCSWLRRHYWPRP